MIFRPHHVAFSVKNLEESVEWYKEKLYFQVEHTYNKNGMRFVVLRCRDVRLELFSFDENLQELPNYRKNVMSDLRVIGTKHLCIEIDNLDKSIKELKEKGIEFATEIDTASFGGRYIFFRDCNGILIELYQK